MNRLKRFRYVLCLCCLLILGGWSSLKANEEGNIYLLRDDQLLQWNVLSPEAQPIEVLQTGLNLETFTPNAADEWRILSARVDQTEAFLYTLETFGRTKRHLPTTTRLVQTDLTTGERTVLVDRNGLFSFVLSPDQTHMIVAFYEGDYAESRKYACVLDLASKNCQNIDLEISYDPGYWIDDHNYVVYSFGPNSDLYKVDIESDKPVRLSLPHKWYVYSGAPIPATETLMISARQRTDANQNGSQFIKLDLATMQQEILPYRALDDDYSGVGSWAFSQDGAYLLYGGITQSKALINLESGGLIMEIQSVISSAWLNERTLVVQRNIDNTDTEIILLDAASGEKTQLAQGDDATGLLIVP